MTTLIARLGHIPDVFRSLFSSIYLVIDNIRLSSAYEKETQEITNMEIFLGMRINIGIIVKIIQINIININLM